MNLTFLHLTLVHIPILFVPLGLCFFLLSLRNHNRTLKSTGLGLFILSGVFVVPAFLLGEEAEDGVKPIAAVDKHDIEEHEAAADFALWWTIALGVLALGQVAVDKYKPEKSKKLTIPLIIFGLFSTATLSKTAWEGGKIRHPEAHEKAPKSSISSQPILRNL